MNHVNPQRSTQWARAFNRFSEGFWREATSRAEQAPAAAQSPAAAQAPASSALEPERRHQVVLSAAEYLRQHYSDPVVGVIEPDVKVAAADALTTAQRLAEQRLAK